VADFVADFVSDFASDFVSDFESDFELVRGLADVFTLRAHRRTDDRVGIDQHARLTGLR
jgi:hypothetical protein